MNLSSIQSPKDLLNMILLLMNEFLTTMINILHFLLAKFNEVCSPETQAHWLAVATPFLIAGFGVVLIRLCCRTKKSSKMMKAPGRGGRVSISRSSFEGQPKSYFRDLRKRD
ncbi:hypothetical protein SOVF_215340 [Spinacia oleracea]|nr:hypothetical protein SOVF_215340 [Spinacia oleracea]